MLSAGMLWSMTKESVTAWIGDFAPSMGAAIAYYTAFSLAPLIVIVVAIMGFAFGEEAANGYLYGQISGLLGDAGAEAVQAMVKAANSNSEGIIATVVSVVLLFVGATTVFGELQTDLDRIWKAPAAVKSEGLWKLIRGRVLSLGLVVSIGFVMLVSLVISAALVALGEWWGGAFENFKWLLEVLNFAVSLVVITVMFALMYKILPRVRIGWHDVWIGAGVTALLFTIGKFLLGLYLGKAGVASSFGAAGSLAVLLVWVYYSAQIFLLGAEFTWVYAHRAGSRKGQDAPRTAKESMATERRPSGGSPPQAMPGTRRHPPRVGLGRPRAAIFRVAATAGVALAVGVVAGELTNRRGR